MDIKKKIKENKVLNTALEQYALYTAGVLNYNEEYKTPNELESEKDFICAFTETVEGELSEYSDWLAMGEFKKDSSTIQPEEIVNKWRSKLKQYLLERKAD